MSRIVPAVCALVIGVLICAAAIPRFVGGAAIAPYEDLLRGIARGEKADRAAVDAAREAARVSLDWYGYDRTWLRLGAFDLVAAGLGKDRAERRRFLDASIDALRDGLARSPGDAYGWLQLAQAMRERDGAVAALNGPFRMSLVTAPYEHRLVMPRLEIAFSAWSVLSPDLRASLGPQIVRAVDTAPVQLARATRRFYALRQVRRALAGSPVHMERFNIVYLNPD